MASELKSGQLWQSPTGNTGSSNEDWWKSTNLGGTVNESTGVATFPYGPRYSFLSTPSGNTTVTTPGATVSRENRAGKIIVDANNVTVADCQAYAVDIIPGRTGTVVEYCKILPPNCWTTSQGATEAGIRYANYTVRYTEISNTFDGLKAFGNVTIDNCYVHDMTYCSDAGNTGGGYPHSDGIQSGGGSGLTVSNSVFANTGENSGIFLFRDGAGGYGNNPLTNVNISNTTITQGGNYGLWLEEASDPSVPSDNKLITNVTVSNVYLGSARSTQYSYPAGTPTSAPTWRGKLNVYFPTTSFTANWSNVYSLNGTANPVLIPLQNTATNSNYNNIQIVL
jgi:hypothetical protein